MESDYLDDLEMLLTQVTQLLLKEKTDNLTKAMLLIESEKCLELEALTDAEAVRRSDEEDYQSRND
jgi:hypothetical protein